MRLYRLQPGVELPGWLGVPRQSRGGGLHRLRDRATAQPAGENRAARQGSAGQVGTEPRGRPDSDSLGAGRGREAGGQGGQACPGVRQHRAAGHGGVGDTGGNGGPGRGGVRHCQVASFNIGSHS